VSGRTVCLPVTVGDNGPLLLANVHDRAGVPRAIAAGAAGIGLLRTEFMFAGCRTEPDGAEQSAMYGEVMAALGGRIVVVRTWDVGGDKGLPFLPSDPERNPALGMRGIRYYQRHPGLLDRQLASIAVATAATGAATAVMAPMVTVPEEAEWFVERTRTHGLASVGVMVEVPAAALMAREIADVVDFVSIGTNDLAQFAFAADRTIRYGVPYADPWQPALLRLVRLVVEGATGADIPTGMCGLAAAEPAFAAVAAGLGVSSISAPLTMLPALVAVFSATTISTQQAAAQAACAARTAADGRSAARQILFGQ